ncbi:MAG: hypothetical protein AN488_20915, partial [Anabaena sp. WA113]
LVTTAHTGQGGAQVFLATDVHIIPCGHGHAAAGLARCNRDGLAVAQGEAQTVVAAHRQAVLAGQGHGVGHRATFGHGGLVCTQGGNHFTFGIADGDGGIATKLQVLEGFAHYRGTVDAHGQGIAILEHVIALRRRAVGHAGLARRDCHTLAIAQGHGQIAIQYLAHLDGEHRLVSFGHITVALDGHRNLVAFPVGLVSHLGGHRLFAQRQLLKLVTTAHTGQGGAQVFLATDVHIIPCGHGHAAAGLARCNRDGLAVAQGEAQTVVAAHRQAVLAGQGHGVGHRATFGHGGLVCTQGGNHFTFGIADGDGGI